jgi:antitoxin component YwqK of YwqJK toxin-antitoxin module
MLGRIAFFQIILFQFFIHASGQLVHRNINQYDEDGKRHGRWIEYYDEEEKIVSSELNYKHGFQDGICKFYHPNGKLRLKWRYYKNRIRAKYFYEDGKLEQKGWSKIEYGGEATHYYWHGKWKFYDHRRKLIRTSFYQNGEEITEER